MTRQPRRIAVMLDLQWPYKRHAAVFAGIHQYAEQAGWNVLIDEFAHHTLRRQRGRTQAYDGIIARANTPLMRWAERRRVPVVNVWQSSPARTHFPGVFPDSAVVGRLLAEHLLARGFRTFATITAPKNLDHELEVREFVRITKEAGFGCTCVQVPQNPWRDHAHWLKTERLLQRCMNHWATPIGVYAGSEAFGRMVVQACQQRGWRVPEDVALIAGKNEQTLCERPHPTLTSVEIGYDRIGYEAAKLLDHLMDGGSPPTEPIRLPPQGLVVRASTDFYAVDHELVAAALAFISANSHRSIGQNDVAHAVGAETRTLQNYFRKVLDRPIATEIRRVRIERAKRELAQGNRPLSAIAYDVGFGSVQRLYEVFRRELGISPRAYRQQRQLEKP